MYQTTITDREAGQRLDKYLHRILPNAASGFLYKMLRKKNITLNGKKADGSEKIAVGDRVSVYFSEDTLAKFMGKAQSLTQKESAYRAAFQSLSPIRVLYENDHILLADKPAGVLSQKASENDLSLNEWLIGYLLESGFTVKEELALFKPSVCNRLDRNTSGIVLCAKSLKGAQMLGALLKERTLHKYYQLYVKGRMEEEKLIEGYLIKDERHNKVSVSLKPPDGKDSDSAKIKTKYRPLRTESDKTLLEVELITGKSHQIRAHLSGIGHPLLGDYKYGDRAWNETYRQKYGVKSQLLHAYKVVFPSLEQPFADVSERTFLCELPEIFERVSGLS